MTISQLSKREERLLRAALHPDGAIAAASFEEWASEIELEEAPDAELRLLTPVYAHLSRAAPSLKLPRKLRGKAKAAFAENHLLAHECLPIIEELGQRAPVILTKGFAICIRFNAWSSRAMGDVDIHVPLPFLEEVCRILEQSGWIPKYGMTWASLVHRSSLRRNSWNLTKANCDLDLHWRVQEKPDEDWFTNTMWSTAERAEFLGQTVLLQSPEFAFISALTHGFLQGSRSDALQTVVDTAWLLPVCSDDKLANLIGKAELVQPFRELVAIFDRVGLSDRVSRLAKLNDMANTPRAASAGVGRPGPRPTENAVLRRPWAYRLWNALGRRSKVERLLLKLAGPFSNPLEPAQVRDEYDLRDCAVIDEIGGPGWSWPEPDGTGFWADRADARLLVPLKLVDDHLLVVTFSEQQVASPNARVDVFANGLYVTRIDFSERISATACCLMITRRMLFGPWVELSFRPSLYLGEAKEQRFTRSVPVRKLRVMDLKRMTEIFSGHNVAQLHLRLLRGEEPHASKLARIDAKIDSSPHKNASEIPVDFDPLLYVLSYPDLFESEVDPYQHFLSFGRHEHRAWR